MRSAFPLVFLCEEVGEMKKFTYDEVDGRRKLSKEWKMIVERSRDKRSNNCLRKSLFANPFTLTMRSLKTHFCKLLYFSAKLVWNSFISYFCLLQTLHPNTCMPRMGRMTNTNGILIIEVYMDLKLRFANQRTNNWKLLRISSYLLDFSGYFTSLSR